MKTLAAAVLAAALSLVPGPLRAEDETARRDGNRTPVQLGISNTSGEIRQIRTTDTGAILVSPAAGSPAQSVNQGNAGTQEWPVKTSSTSKMDVSGSTVNVSGSTVTVQTANGNPLKVDVVGGSISAAVSGSTVVVTGSTVSVRTLPGETLKVDVVGGSISAGVSGSTVHVKNASGDLLNVADGGGSLTVDANNLDVRDLLFATDKVDVTGSAVQVSNAGGVAAVNIQDGGNVISVDDAGGSLTVDGTVAATQSGAWTVTANAGTGTMSTDPTDRAARVLGRAFLRDPTDSFNMGSAAAPVRVDPTGVSTQPVSVGSLPLPAGAATESTLAALNSKVPASPAQDRVTATGPGAVRLSDGAAFYKATTPSDTQPISAASLPLPSGAATEAKQDTGNTSLGSIDGKLPSTVAADRTTAGAPHATRLSDGTAFYKATTPSDTQPISAAALPLPAGAATETTAAGIKVGTDRIPNQGQAAMAASLPVAIASNQSAIPVSQSGAWTVTATPGAGQFNTSGSTVHVKNEAGGTLAVSDGGGSLTVDAVDLDVRNLTFAQDKVDASGSTLGANSGVDIGDVTVNNTGGAGAVPIQDGGNSITVDDGGSSLTVDGTVTANAGTGIFNTSGSTVSVQNMGGTSLAVNDNSGSLTVDAVDLDIRNLNSNDDSVSAVQSGAWTVTSNQGTAAAQSGRWPVFWTDGTNERGTATLPLRVDPTGSTTQPVSGTVTANAGTGTFNIQAAAAAPAAARLSDGSAFYAAAKDSQLPASLTGAGNLKVSLQESNATQAVSQSGAWTVTANAGTGLFNVSESTVHVRNATGETLLVGDGSGPLTVDGTVAATQSGSWSVAVSNGAGGAAVNIQDGGNSITVDGTVTANAGTGTFAVDNAAGQSVAVDDNGSSLTVDSPQLPAALTGGGNLKVSLAESTAVQSVSQSGAWTVTANAGTGVFNTTGSTVSVNGSTVAVRTLAGESLAVNDAGGSITVDATDLDVRNLSNAQDSVTAHQGGAWTVTAQDGGGSLTVDAVDLDVRNLSSAQDSVAAVQSGAWTVTANAGSGSFSVAGSTVHVQNTNGGSLAVNDSGGSLTTDTTQLPAALTGSGNLKVSLAESTAVQAVSQSGSWSVGLNAGTNNIGTVSGSTVVVRNGAGADAINVQDGGNSLTVDAVDLDIRNLSNAQDSVTAHQGGAWTVTAQDGGGSLTVDAVDLDVRDLSFATDKADVGGSTVQVRNAAGESLAVNDAGGSLTVDGTVTANQGGSWSVAVNNAGGASAVNVQDGGNSLTVDDGGGSLTVDGTVAATQSGAWTVTANAGTGIFNTTGSTVSVANQAGTSLAVNDNGSTLSVDDGGGSLTMDTAQLPAALTGSGNLKVALAESTAVQAVSQSGTWTVGLSAGSNNVGTVSGSTIVVRNAAGADAVNIQDGGNVISVDDAGGSLTVDATDLDIRNLSSGQDSVAAVQSGAWSVTLNAGTNQVGTVSGSTIVVRNAGGADAINIQDGGNSITVDGTVSAAQSGAWTVTANAGTGTMATDPTDRVARKLGQAFLRNPGDTANMGDATTPVRVDPTGTTAQPVTDNGGSLTVDATSLDIRALTFAADKADVGGSTVHVRNVAGGSLSVDDAGGSLTVDGTVTAGQGAAAAQSGRWPVFLSDGTNERGTSGNPLRTDPTGTTAQPASQSGTWNVGLNAGSNQVGTVSGSTIVVRNAGGSDAVNIQDGGNSITVDGTVSAVQSGTWVLGANSGVDVGDVTVNNGSGASAVNIQDGGNSITVDTAGGALSVEGQGYTGLAPTTHTVTGSALQIYAANATAVGRMVCNEGSVAVRVGPSNITADVGLRILPNSCLGLDTLHRYHRGDLWAIAVSGSQKVTTSEATP